MLSSFLAAVFTVLAFIGSCFGVKEYDLPPETHVFAAASGAWDWTSSDDTCVENPHTISFTPAHDYMILRYPLPIDTATGRREAVYRIVDTTRSSIRSDMLGETRVVYDELVTWDLVFTGADSYRWRAAQSGAYSGTVVRCPDAPLPPAVPDDSAHLGLQGDEWFEPRLAPVN